LLLSDVFPKDGEVRRLYCDGCGQSMDLAFADFSEDVSGVEITIRGLPHLHCHRCDKYYLTDDSRFAIIRLHEEAIKKGSNKVSVTKQKRPVDFKFTDVPFLVDADDYRYIPGLYRQFDVGFLCPLYFNKEVLLKFDNSPKYEVRFASQSYGTVDMEEGYIPFGINRHGKVIIWLGDIAKLSESEQFYLRSENIESDHSIGSEFYDGQIECIFTEPPKEASIITGRTELDQAFEAHFKAKLYHLDKELIDTIAALTPPVVDTEKERKHIFDSLTRIFIESMDNAKLDRLLKGIGASSAGSGSLKRFQAALETIDSSGVVATALMPLYVLYDLRVAYSHLTSGSRRGELLSSAAERLGIRDGAGLSEIYGALMDAMIEGLKSLHSIRTSTDRE
jgi:hypothetical protein